MTDTIPMMLALRAYALPIDSKRITKHVSQPKTVRPSLPTPSDYAVVVDCETGTDHAQNLRFGGYQVRKRGELIEKGLFYEPDNVTPDDLALLTGYATGQSLKLLTRDYFVKFVLYRYGYERGGLIVGFNLPFDLSRLAISSSTSHGKDMRGGFSFKLALEKWRPPVLVKHLSSRMAFIRFAAAPGPVDGRGMRKKGFKTKARRGHFQDVKTAAAALLGGSMNLSKLANLLGTEHRKLETDEHGGPLSREYIGYAVNDVQVTWECYEELQKQFVKHGLTGTPLHRIYSEASLGKANFREMGIERWTKLQPDFPPEMLGIIMSTYYGGRSEIRIRRKKTRVLYADFRSMYPTVCALMNLWPFVIATGIEHRDCTRGARSLLRSVELSDIGKKEFWPQLTMLVQVVPNDDVFPVRAAYGETNRTIGLNHLTSDKPLWYTLADCIASKLLTGRAPRITKAIHFTPKVPQAGLRPIEIGKGSGIWIDPLSNDFYTKIILERGRIQTAAKKARQEGTEAEANLLEALQMMLKLLANSTSYGIFAEMNVQSYDRPRTVKCYGNDGKAFRTDTKSIEEPGTNYHPLIATLITGAARLMLAAAERNANDVGIGWALCDTDSLALARPDGMTDDEFLLRSVGVTKWFDGLDPYGDGKPLFKLEDQNYRLDNGKLVPGSHEPLYVLTISAKRYVLFNLDATGRPIIRKAVAHGLGHWLPPYAEKESPASIPAPACALSEIGCDRWQYDLWYQIILADLDGHPDTVDLTPLPHLDRPAASRYHASTPALLHWFDRFNRRQPRRKRLQPFNFLLSFQASPTAIYASAAKGQAGFEFIDDGLPAVVAPYSDKVEVAAKQAFDRRTGRRVPARFLAAYREVLANYHLHSESKFENGDTFERGLTRRRHVRAVGIEYIGKEANKWEEQYYVGEIPEAQIEYGASHKTRASLLKTVRDGVNEFGVAQVSEKASLSRQQLSEILARLAKPRLRTLKALMWAVQTLRFERNQLQARETLLRENLRCMIESDGITKVARAIGIDPSNLRKVFEGTRGVDSKLADRIEARQSNTAPAIPPTGRRRAQS